MPDVYETIAKKMSDMADQVVSEKEGEFPFATLGDFTDAMVIEMDIICRQSSSKQNVHRAIFELGCLCVAALAKHSA